MPIGTVFMNNGVQAVSLSADTGFPDEVELVSVRVIGTDRVLSPVDNAWDS